MNEWIIPVTEGLVSGLIGALVSGLIMAFRFAIRLSRLEGQRIDPERLTRLEQQHTDLEKRFDRLENQIFGALRRIEEKLDRKADRE